MATANPSYEHLRLPGRAAIENTESGLTRVRITGAHSDGEVYLQGGHVTRFHKHGEKPLLYLSPNSAFRAGKAIRGGVPVIFPWFGARAGHPEAAQHGFARTREWTLESIAEDFDGGVEITLTLKADAATRAVWDFDFLLRLRARFALALELSLEVENTGSAPFSYEEALHTYLEVGDAREISLNGLEGVEYLDKTDEFRWKREGDGPLRLTGETDRTYMNTATEVIVTDPVGGRTLLVEKEGSHSTVVWNPWNTKAAALADLGSEEWVKMVCVESGNIGENAVTLATGEKHAMGVMIRTEAAFG